MKPHAHEDGGPGRLMAEPAGFDPIKDWPREPRDEQEVRDLLTAAGYNPDWRPCGHTTDQPASRFGSLLPGSEPLRGHVCQLDGVAIDGHWGSDLDPTSTACLRCDFQGPNP